MSLVEAMLIVLAAPLSGALYVGDRGMGATQVCCLAVDGRAT